MCPNCNKKSYCGCKSCKSRKGLLSIRSNKFNNGDFIKCPYCRKNMHIDSWLEEDFKQYELKLNK